MSCSTICGSFPTGPWERLFTALQSEIKEDQQVLKDLLGAVGGKESQVLALWRALGVAADRVPQIRKLDIGTPERRAREQHERADTERLKWPAAFSS